MNNEINPSQFLEALWPEDDTPGSLVVWTRGRQRRRSGMVWCESAGQVEEVLRRYRDVRNVFFGVVRQDPDRALELARQKRPAARLGNVRGSAGSAVALPGLWVDVDVRAEVHSCRELPPDLEAARGLLEAVGLEPSVIVATGYGLHAYWLFREPWLFESDEDRAEAEGICGRLQRTIREAARPHGWKVDHTSDLARTLRLPGSLNLKADRPRPVTVESFRPERRYGRDELAAACGESEPVDGRGSTRGSAPTEPRASEATSSFPPLGKGGPRGDFSAPPADIDAVVRGCSWLVHCRDDRAALPEPEWYAALSIVSRCGSDDASPRDLAHEWSREHPGYSVAETDRKAEQAKTASGPRTCSYVAEQLQGWGRHCSRCPHWGRVRSPIVLGRRRSERPVVMVAGNDEKRVNDEALAALAGHPDLYRRGGALVRIVPRAELPGKKRNGPPRIVPMQEATLREMLSERADFRKPDAEGGARPARPPRYTVKAIHARGHWPRLRPLAAVTECPVLRADGSVLQEPGYDPSTGLYYAPGLQFPPVPERPVEAQLREALAELREAVCDFPFKSEAHFSAWLAAVLTPLARPAFVGPSPCLLLDANVRGCGKSLLVSVASLIATGRQVSRMAYSTSQEEQRKAILGIALAGIPMVLIDNVAGKFGSPVLDAALTASEWIDRLLGANSLVSAPLKALWCVTGNNLTVVGDTVRRCLPVRLESPAERPEQRDDFRHPRLLEWLSRRQARLTSAALTLLRGYCVAGRPDPGLEPWGSFEGWSSLIRGCLAWLGLPDPGKTRRELSGPGDAEGVAVAKLVAGLEEVMLELGGRGTVGDVLSQLVRPDRREWYHPLREAFVELLPGLGTGELPRPSQLGALLRQYRGRFVDGKKVDHARQRKTRRGVIWCVRPG